MLRIVSLNTWSGRMKDKLYEYIASQASDSVNTDIFLFQEVYDSILEMSGKDYDYNEKAHIKEVLPEYQCIYHVNNYWSDYYGRVDFDCRYGLGAFVKTSDRIKIVDSGDILVGDALSYFDDTKPENFLLQYLRLVVDGKPLNVLNYHGVWIPGFGKGEHEVRDSIFDRVINVVKEFIQHAPTLIMGDFNLDNNGKYTQMFQDLGMRNLISEYSVSTTRPKVYPRWREEPDADFCFVTRDIQINDFRVPNIEVSDHLPLILEID